MRGVFLDNKKENLILFFHGWGGDEKMLSHLNLHEYDCIILYDYRLLEMENELLKKIKSYKNIHVISWSFGVWAGAYICQKYHILPIDATAYNGTLYPLDDKRGISPSIAQGTLEQLNEENLLAFYKRMFQNADDRERFLKLHQLKNITQLKNELENLYNAFRSFSLNHTFYTRAFVSKKDKIFLSRKQKNAWLEDGAKIDEIESGHFCFYGYKSWDELC